MNKGIKHHLFCPGPVNTAASVKHAAFENEIGHREYEFEQLFEKLQKNVLDAFQIKKKNDYLPVFISGSGSSANEAVLSSIVGNQTILVISNGEFGERLYKISKLHNPNTVTIAQDWGKKISLTAVKKYLKENKVDIIAMVHHETCSGMLNPVEEIGALAKKYGITFFVDTVSSAGADKIDLEKWNASFCSTSASKALAALPGVAIVIGKIDAFQKIATLPQRTMYLNLYSFYDYAHRLKQTPNTPAVPLFFALNAALENSLTQGISKKLAQTKKHAKQLRQGMKKLGLSFLIDEKLMSSSLTTVVVPETISTALLKANLRNKNIIIYEGKGVFKDKVFQVANIGEITADQIQFFLGELKHALTLSGIITPAPKTRYTKNHIATRREAKLPLLSSHLYNRNSSTK